MRALLVVAATLAACAPPTAQPYRFSSPLLGRADVPPPALPGPERKPLNAPASRSATRTASASPKPRAHYAYGWQVDAQAGIRVASAKGIELSVPEASAQSADAVTKSGVVYSRLPSPNKPAASGVTTAIDLPGLAHIREAVELRGWVGRRDKRRSVDALLDWLVDLSLADDALAAAETEAEVVAWATQHGVLLAPTQTTKPGDVLVFDRATTEAPSDLLGLVIGRDDRGVTEFVYLAGGVIRRGFVDVTRASARRDLRGNVINTFVRHVRRMPPKGTRYLAGELLSGVIRLR